MLYSYIYVYDNYCTIICYYAVTVLSILLSNNNNIINYCKYMYLYYYHCFIRIVNYTIHNNCNYYEHISKVQCNPLANHF